MEKIIFALVLGAGCGIVGSVYRFILAYEKPFTKWWRFGNRYEKRWFFRPVWGCAKCFAGQLAAWSWLLTEILPRVITHLGRQGDEIRFLIHTTQTAGLLVVGVLIAISTAITVAVILGPILESKNQQ